MLYLEDYLEMIEHLPQELRDRFTEIRELDLSVQNSLDTLEQRVRNLFNNCHHGEMTTEQALVEYVDIQRGYEKTAEEADEKVALAKQMYDLVNRYIKKLDAELYKFKCELEADNKGITEILEKRSLEIDPRGSSGSSGYKDGRYRVRAEKRNWSSTREPSRPAAIGGLPRSESAIQAALSRDYNPSYTIHSAGSVLAAAASQAIAATQQLQSGRRTASMKASYEAVNVVANAIEAAQQHDHGMGPSTSMIGSPAPKRPKHKKTPYTAPALSSHPQPTLSSVASRSSSPSIVDVPVQGNVTIEEVGEEEWTYDPNEPRYCMCNQVSYGDMVACDNQDCPYEWFHYPCVGITAPPKGKWYCPQCQTNMRRNRANRKN